MPRRLGPRGSRFVLIVDASLIAHVARCIENEDLGCPLGTKFLGQGLPVIFDHGERDAMFFGESLDVVRRVLWITVDPHHLHAVTGELLAQLLQTRPVKPRQWTLGSQEGNGTRRASLAMMFKLAQSASKKWNRLRSHEKMTLVVEGRSFQDGILQEFAA